MDLDKLYDDTASYFDKFLELDFYKEHWLLTAIIIICVLLLVAMLLKAVV